MQTHLAVAHCTHLWCGPYPLGLQVLQVSPCREFRGPKEMTVSQDSREYLDPRDSLVRSAHRVHVTTAEAVKELHRNQVSDSCNSCLAFLSLHLVRRLNFAYALLVKKTRITATNWTSAERKEERVLVIVWKDGGSFEQSNGPGTDSEEHQWRWVVLPVVEAQTSLASSNTEVIHAGRIDLFSCVLWHKTSR